MAAKVTDAGLAIATNLLSGLGGTVPKYCASGTGTNAPAHGDTALQTEDSGGSPAYARATGTPTRGLTNVANDTLLVAGTQTYGHSVAITEAGLFDAITVGNLFARATFSAINVVANATIAWSWSVSLVSA